MTKYYKIFIFLLILPTMLFSFFKKDKIDLSKFSKSFYDYAAISIDGEEISMSEFKGKKILIVNVASRCGYTPQYDGLQELYEKYSDQLVILGFPSNDFLFQEPGGNDKIKTFCRTRYGVTFPMFEKTVVKNNSAQHPIYTWLSNESLNGKLDSPPSWNFCKYLIDEEGNLLNFFGAKVKPLDSEITSFLNK